VPDLPAAGTKDEGRRPREGEDAFDWRPARCPTCGPGETAVLGWRGGRFQRHGRGVPARIVRCRTCSLLFPDPFPVPRDPQELYGDPERYFEGFDEEEKTEDFRRVLAEARRRWGAAPSVLDVGSGRGEMLLAARREGLADAVGLELSRAMIRHARERHGIDLVPGTLEAYAASAGRTFDLLVLVAILEHVRDPDAFMAAAARLTRPGSLAYIDIPRDPNLLTVLGNAANRLLLRRAVLNLSPTWPPYHVWGFTPRSLAALLRKHGFAVESLRVHARPRIPAGPGWTDRMRAFAGEQVIRIANLTGTSTNMFVWARRTG